ncbi:MAG TPA: nuclear transport factor 2 family protein [Flavobacteriaceae bacterium]|nr:nuclear transport factor 2 family protein [Flavobacteriaceae bacterium]
MYLKGERMKKIYFLFIVLSMCVGASEVRSNLNLYVDAWNKHDEKRIRDTFSENVKWYDLCYDYTTEGKDNVSKEIIKAFLGSVKDMHWLPKGDVFELDNTIIFEWVYGGTYNGLFDEKKISNKKFEIKGLSVIIFNKNGKIDIQKDYYNLDDLKNKLGIK